MIDSLYKNKLPDLIESSDPTTGEYITDFFTSIPQAGLKALGGIANYVEAGERALLDVFYRDLTPEQKAEKIKELEDSGESFLTKDGYNIFSSAGSYFDQFDVKADASITEDFKNGNYAKGGARAVVAGVESWPSLVAAFMGTPALLALGASYAGNKFEEEFEKNPKASMTQLFANATGTGVIEAGFEIATRGLFKKAGLLQAVPGGAKAAKEVVKGGFVELGKNLGFGFAGEGLSEAATELTSAYFDSLTLEGNEMPSFNQIKYRLSDAFIVGGLIGGTISGFGEVAKKGKAAKERATLTLMPVEDKKVYSTSLNNLKDLYSDRKKTKDGSKAQSLIDSIIQQEITTIEEIKNRTQTSLENLNSKKIKQYTENIVEINELNAELKENVDNKTVVNSIKENIEALSQSNNTLLQESILDLGEKTTKNIKNQIEKAGMAGKVTELTSEQISKLDIKDEDGVSLSQEASSQYGFIDQKQDGSFEIIINKDKPMVGTAAHEFMHAVLFKTVGGNKEIQTRLGDALVEHTKNIGGETSILGKRLAAYGKFNNKGEFVRDDNFGEETITIMSESIVDGQLSFDEKFFTKIGDIVRRFAQNYLGKEIVFDNGRDVYNFVKDYSKSVKDGKINPAILRVAKEGAKGKLVEGKVDAKAVVQSSKEASDKVQSIYENEGAAGAFDIINEFKPIVGKIVEKRRDAPNFDRELLTSEIEIGKRGILDLIAEYKPESGVPLAAFINKYLPSRAIEASKRILGEQFTQDVTEQKSVASKETAEDTTNIEQRAKKELAEEKPSIRKKINIETNSKLYNKVKDAVIKTFGTKLPSISNKKFKATLQKAYRTELKKPIADFMGTRAKFESFLKDYGKEVYNKIDQSLINKRFKQFAEPVLDSDGKQKREKTPQGNAIFKKKKFNQGEWVSYFLSKGVGASTRGTRKDALAETIGEELGFDATMEVLTDPDVAARRKDILDLFEQEQVVNELEIIAKEIDRNPKMQFSKTSKDYMSGIDFMNQAGSLIQEINNGNEVFGSKGEIKIKYESVDGLVDYDGDVVKLVYDAYHNVRIGTDKTVDILKKFSKELGDANVGTTYEYMVWQKIEDFAKNNKRIQNSPQTFAGPGEGKVYLAPIGSFKGGFVAAPDLILTIDKATAGETQISVELKASAARLGKNSPDFVDWANKTFIREKRTLNQKGKAEKSGFTQTQLDKFEALVNKVIGNVIKKSGPLQKALKEKMPGLTDITSTTKIPRLEVWNTVTGKGSSRALTNDSSVMADGDFVANHYNSKGVYYIHVLGKGTFYLGSDPLGIAKELGITKLEGNFPLKGRINAVSDKKGNITMKITVEPELQLSYITSKSTFDITSKEGLDKVLNTKRFLANKKIAEIIKPETKTLNNSIKKARKISHSKEPRGITVLDFDDTLATSKSLIRFTRPDGSEGTLTPEQYASTYEDLGDKGYKFDFSEFNKVVDGKIAPLFQKALKLQTKFGNNDMFVLTARPAESAPAIFAFLKSKGLNIPLKNITGLANSTAEAKALWIADKVSEGYNDFYFADDALQNVQAVDNMLEQFDVKRKVQQAKIQFSKDMNEDFNDILEDVSGIESKKRFDFIKARKRGASKGKFRLFIPPSHEDFVGLLYNFMGKGKEGNAHRDFLEQALVRPLNRGNKEYDTARQSVATDYKSLNKQFPTVKNALVRKTPDGDFTYQDAIRIYLWDKHGYKIPGLSPIDQNNLVEIVKSNKNLTAYSEALNVISKQETYVDPTDGWNSGDIRMDLDDATGRIGRAQFFEEFSENADVIFSKENLNKIEAGFGNGVREALEDILYRIKTGRNRPSGQNQMVNKLMNWVNGSVGSVMFFNMRSALLQQMSIVNYINFADNNIFAAAKAFANQKQYWSDFAFIFNSDMLKQRRGGIQTDVNGAELAADMRKSKNPSRFLISKLLELGFLPTQIGDNIAIATGGASYYRNRINKYIKEGLSQKEAEAKAFTDFQDITQSTQQSARPDMVSQQQASVIGKVILNFQNVTSQFNRLGKKAFQDIYNRRITKPNSTQMQSDISNASRITYYFAVQNLIFYTLQTALFAMMFGDEEEDNNKLFLKKKERLLNGTLDSVLRGTGLLGSVVSTLKNVGIAFARQRDVKYNPDESAVLIEALNLSPVLGIKARKISNAEKTLNYNKKVIDQMETFDIDNPQWSAVTNYVEAGTNLPLNRLYNKTQNVRQAFNNDHAAWERTLLFLGWSQYNLNLTNEKMDKIKESTKSKKQKKKSKLQNIGDSKSKLKDL